MNLNEDELRSLIEAIEYVPSIDFRLSQKLKQIKSKLIQELRKSYEISLEKAERTSGSQAEGSVEVK